MAEKYAFRTSCDAAASFPKSLVYHNTYKHILDTHVERLNKQENRLFCDEDKADLELWEYRDQSTGTKIGEAIQLSSNLLTRYRIYI